MRSLLCVTCLFFTHIGLINAAPDAPKEVSALIYSSSAAELFWTPATDTTLEVSRNGVSLGEVDARSLFQPGLDSNTNYTYILRAVAPDGSRSTPIVLEVSTANFRPPVKRVYPLGTDAQSDLVIPPPPEPVQANDLALEQPFDMNTPAAQESATTPVIVQGDNNCIASDTASLRSCVRNAGSYQRIDIANNIRCDNNCCPGGQALLSFNSLNGLEVNGHGNRVQRSNNQRQCSLLDIQNASDIRFTSLYLDDDKSVEGCQVNDNCARMVHIRNSRNIHFSQTHISHGKGYAVYVQATNGFRFENSSLHNSGVLGMYIGHGSNASSNVQVIGSRFTDNQTNGLALLGVKGQQMSDNVVADNVFLRNHRKGQWAVLPRFGTGFTGGGQLYVAEANNVTVRNNVIKDGYCDNCYVQRVARSGVSGIELGLPNKSSVANADISGNRVANLDGFGIAQNSNSALSNVTVRDNRIINTSSGTHVSGAQTSSNRVVDTQQFQSFEASNSVGTEFTGGVQCSAGGAVQRQCGEGSRFGQCAALLRLGSADCSGTSAELLGPSISVSAGQSVFADGWVSNPAGRWCIRFKDGSGNQLNEQCRDLSASGSSDVQSFVGLPQLEVSAPQGTRSAQLRITHQQTGFSMLIDDLKVSVGP